MFPWFELANVKACFGTCAPTCRFRFLLSTFLRPFHFNVSPPPPPPPPPCAKEVLWSSPNPQKKSTFSQSVQKNALMNIQLLRKCVQHVKYLNKISAFLLLAIWALLIVSSWCQLELIWWLPCFFFLQFSTSAFLRLSWAWISFVKLRAAWERLQCLFWQHYSS